MPSTVIRSHSYSPESGVMEVTFVSGFTYRYFDVPPELYRQFITTFSKGNFFNRYIKPGRAFERLSIPDK